MMMIRSVHGDTHHVVHVSPQQLLQGGPGSNSLSKLLSKSHSVCIVAHTHFTSVQCAPSIITNCYIYNIYKYIQYEYETLWTWFLFSEVRLLARQTCVETCQIVLFSCFVLLPGSYCLYSVRLTGTRTAQTLSE